MQKTPPSPEALLDMTRAIYAALAKPGEMPSAFLAAVLVENPNSGICRLAVTPKEDEARTLRIVRQKIDEMLG